MYAQTSEDSQDVPQVNVEKAESILFPSLSQTARKMEGDNPPISSTPPDSNASASSALTYSDKLSALPQSVATPRSPHSPRFRHSLDASKSWPNIAGSQAMSNIDALGMSNAWKDTVGTGSIRATASEGSLERERGRRSLDSDRGSFPTVHSVKHAFQRLHRGSDPASPPAGLRNSEQRRDTPDAASRSASESRSRAASPLRILQQWSSGLHRTYTHHEDTDPFIPVNPFQSNFPFRLPNLSFFKSTAFTKESPPSDNEELPVFHVTTHETTRHETNADNGRDYTFPGFDRLRRRLRHTKDYLAETFTNLILAIYLHLLLRLPSMYFSRVSRIFEDAEISKPDIRRMIETCKGGSRFKAHGNMNATANANVASAQTQTQPTRSYPQPSSRTERERLPSTSFAANLAAAGLGIASPFGAGPGPGQPQTVAQTHLSPAAASMADVVDVDAVPMLPLPEEWSAKLVSPALMRFKLSWEGFVDSLMKEWKTLNVVSALLLSAILTLFQVPDAATDPLTRTAALLSLICAIMSLSYGCMYIVRFGTMRSMYRASRWAEEAQKTKTFLWWNVWILLAMPAVWMSWAMIFFITAIICYVWRTGSILDPPEREGLPPRAALGPRIAVTGLFIIGMIYFILIVKTLRSYGTERPGMKHRRKHSDGREGRDAHGATGNHGRGGEGPPNPNNYTVRSHGVRGDGRVTPSQGHGYRTDHHHDVNASVWERRGRERERSSSAARRGKRRSESLTRDHHHHHAPRLDFTERVHSLGQSYSHTHEHGQGHRKLFGLGLGLMGGHGHSHSHEHKPKGHEGHGEGAGTTDTGSDWVDLDADRDLEKGLPTEKVIEDEDARNGKH